MNEADLMDIYKTGEATEPKKQPYYDLDPIIKKRILNFILVTIQEDNAPWEKFDVIGKGWGSELGVRVYGNLTIGINELKKDSQISDRMWSILFADKEKLSNASKYEVPPGVKDDFEKTKQVFPCLLFTDKTSVRTSVKEKNIQHGGTILDSLGRDKCIRCITNVKKYYFPLITEENFEYAKKILNHPSLSEEFKEVAKNQRGYRPSDYYGSAQGLNKPVEKGNKEKGTMSALNTILYGPPGTGKTYHTIEAAVKAAEPLKYDELITNDASGEPTTKREQLTKLYKTLTDSGRIRFVTFHQSYGYEEFVEGLKASTESNQISYNVEPGIFKQMCTEAGKNKQNYVLIIDEINRGNISKIFGELITLIEPSKRSGLDQSERENTEALEIHLPNTPKETFSVPNNLYLIGTMNTADRSLAMMDTALRRRFDFVEMMPKPELFKGMKVKEIVLENLLSKMNERIEILYDREHTLGHAFFMSVVDTLNKYENKNENQDAAFTELQNVFKNKIIPLLEEYFFEDWNKIRLVLGDNRKSSKENKTLDKYIFVQEKTKKYSEVFGKNHGLEPYADIKNTYLLADFANENSAWWHPESFQSIYDETVLDALPTNNQTEKPASPEE